MVSLQQSLGAKERENWKRVVRPSVGSMPLTLAARRLEPKRARTPAKGHTGSRWPIKSLSPHHPPHFCSLRRALPRQVQPQVVLCGGENSRRWVCEQALGPLQESCFLIHRKGKVITSNNYILLLKLTQSSSDKG